MTPRPEHDALCDELYSRGFYAGLQRPTETVEFVACQSFGIGTTFCAEYLSVAKRWMLFTWSPVFYLVQRQAAVVEIIADGLRRIPSTPGEFPDDFIHRHLLDNMGLVVNKEEASAAINSMLQSMVPLLQNAAPGKDIAAEIDAVLEQWIEKTDPSLHLELRRSGSRLAFIAAIDSAKGFAEIQRRFNDRCTLGFNGIWAELHNSLEFASACADRERWTEGLAVVAEAEKTLFERSSDCKPEGAKRMANVFAVVRNRLQNRERS
jgi:hypothetical protein